MRDDHEEADEQEEHGAAVLEVVVELARHASEPQQTQHFERAEHVGAHLLLRARPTRARVLCRALPDTV